MPSLLTRKQFLRGGAIVGAGVFAIHRPASAARFTIRLGHDLAADHPTNLNAQIVANRIKEATNGEVSLLLFPLNQLGDDTHMLANLRSGAMQMMFAGDNVLATLVPSCSIDNIGFAFKSLEMAWSAVDGPVGDIVTADIQKAGLFAMRKIWDEGFRQITSGTKPVRTPEDLHGFKMRVPPSPISLAIFQALGAGPVMLNSAEVYTALQTHVADGQENPLGIIETLKFFQVQKYCSMSDHMWVGYWPLMNGAFWNSLPPDIRKIVADAFDTQAMQQRQDNRKLDGTLEDKLKGQGLSFVDCDKAAFQQALTKAGFYSTWSAKFGAPLWSALEKITGPLA